MCCMMSSKRRVAMTGMGSHQCAENSAAPTITTTTRAPAPCCASLSSASLSPIEKWMNGQFSMFDLWTSPGSTNAISSPGSAAGGRMLRLAGWPDDKPVWTGSPLSQPFSVTGIGFAADNPRHLSPALVRRARACRSGIPLGEKFASAEVFGHVADGRERGATGQPLWPWISARADPAIDDL